MVRECRVERTKPEAARTLYHVATWRVVGCNTVLQVERAKAEAAEAAKSKAVMDRFSFGARAAPAASDAAANPTQPPPAPPAAPVAATRAAAPKYTLELELPASWLQTWAAPAAADGEESKASAFSTHKMDRMPPQIVAELRLLPGPAPGACHTSASPCSSLASKQRIRSSYTMAMLGGNHSP